MKETKRQKPEKKVLLFLGVFVFGLLYFEGISIVLRNAKLTIEAQDQIASNEMVKNAISQKLFYDSRFFRTVAVKLEYAGHDPAVLRTAYEIATMKGPSNFENLFAFGVYVASRGELDQAEKLLKEAVRRFPTDPRLSADAGVVLYRAGSHSSALSFLTQALKMDPGLSYDIYPIIDGYGGTVEELVQITSVQPKSVLSLCTHIVSKHTVDSGPLEPVIRKAFEIEMEPEQKLRLISCAMNISLFSLAREEAEKLRADATFGGKVDQLLEEIDRKERKTKNH